MVPVFWTALLLCAIGLETSGDVSNELEPERTTWSWWESTRTAPANNETIEVEPGTEADEDDDRTTIHIAGMSTMTTYAWSRYAKCFPVLIQAAFDDLLNLQNMLAGYRLQLVARDTQGISGKGIQELFDLLQSPYKTPVLMGPARSEVALAVSQAVHYWNMTQIVFSTRSSYFTDRVNNPNVYMTNFLPTALNPMKIAIMKYYGWTKIATLTLDDEIHLSETTDFHQRLGDNNFTLLTSGTVHSNRDGDMSPEETYAIILSRFKQYDARIIFISVAILDLAFVMCQAYNQGVSGKGHVWISVGHTVPDDWQGTYAAGVTSCTVDELRVASQGLLALDHPYLRMDNGRAITGKTPKMYEEWLETLDFPENSLYPRTGPFAYDAALTIGLALNTTIGKLNGSRLEDFDYDRSDIGDIIKQSVQDIYFEGVTGPVFFSEDGSRSGLAYLVQIDAYTFERRHIAVHDPKTGVLTQLAEVDWKGGKVPVDHFTYETVQETLPRGVHITCGVLAVMGILVAVGFLIINVMKRERRVIKMSSPTINNVIIIGAIITYLSVFVYAMGPDDTHVNVCMAKIWMASLGYTIGFGAMFSKTWRVHVLFKNEALQKKIVRDTKLLVMVLVLMGIDLVLLLAWTLWNPLDWKIKTEIVEDDTEDRYIILEYPLCYHQYQNYWFGVLYIYKGLLLAFGLFLTWETRLISIPALNDSKYIGFAVYNVVVVCLFGVPTAHVLSYDQMTIRFCLVSLLYIFCTTFTLCLVFVPKVMLLKKPDGQVVNIRFSSGPGAGIHSKGMHSLTPNVATATEPRPGPSRVRKKCQVSPAQEVLA